MGSDFDKYRLRGAYHWVESSNSLTKSWPYTRSRVDWVVRQCRRAETVLEIGCGDGVILGRLAEAGKKVTGIDADATAITLARERFEEAALKGSFHQELAALDAQTFDAVILAEFIEHVDRPRDYLMTACRHLRNDGALVLTTPIRLLEHSLDKHHVHEFWPSELETMLREFFEDVEMQRMHPAWFIELMCLSFKGFRPFTFSANLIHLATGIELLDRLPSPLGIYWTQGATCRGFKSPRPDRRNR